MQYYSRKVHQYNAKEKLSFWQLGKQILILQETTCKELFLKIVEGDTPSKFLIVKKHKNN